MVDQLSREDLVKIVLTQQKLIEKLQQKLEKLQERQPSNSKTSSKPPSSDVIQKSETAKVDNSKESESESESQPKRKPGGQPGHIGKTRKGFGRVDRYQISTPEYCEHCGSPELSDAIGYSKQQVACLVALPIEVVEYQLVKCQCNECGAMVMGAPASGIVP